MKKTFTFLIAWLCVYSLVMTTHAQNLYAYQAYNNNLIIFDNGNFVTAETLPVLKKFIGFDYVAYISNNNLLKMYWRKQTNEINEAAFITRSEGKRGLFAYQMDKQLKVVYNGKDITLTTFCNNWNASDSLVLFYDDVRNMHFVFYNGDVFALDDVLQGKTGLFNGSNCSIGGNILCYVNSFNKLRAQYNGVFYNLSDYNRFLAFEAGNNICVYLNENSNAWTAFCNGYTNVLDQFEPQSYQLGNGMVAYVDNLQNFKVFYNDTIIRLLPVQPAGYQVTDSLISFSDNVNNWYVFYNGRMQKLENYIPTQIKMSNATLCYIDNVGALRVFIRGKSQVITTEQVRQFEVTNNVVSYTLGNSDVRIYWDGNKY
ncbi:MAG: hypothetical protein JNK61_10205 [Bacteroidia bacterium]|nr:hypothetical protein [Bacteroidia bacterium]HQV01022.1 hypothetical protein [Bacteroidia bacterium]